MHDTLFFSVCLFRIDIVIYRMEHQVGSSDTEVERIGKREEEIELIQQKGTAETGEEKEPHLTFIEQIKRLPAAQNLDGESVDLLKEQQPEIMLAYMAGEPEAVAAIELLREAQRVWNDRKRSSPSLVERSQHHQFLTTPDPSSFEGGGEVVRRYSHDDIRVDTSQLAKHPAVRQKRPSTGNVGNITNKGTYPRRASSQVESLSSSAAPRYQKNLNRKRGGSRQEDSFTINPNTPLVLTTSTSGHIKRPSRGSVDQVSLAMTTAGMASRSGSLHSDAVMDARRPSHQRLHPSLPDEGLLLGAEAASLMVQHQQRRRASSKASAIFMVSPTNKDTQLVPEPEDEDDGSPEGRRRRRTISIIATVGAFLLVLSILLVTITLRLATHIDELGKDCEIFIFKISFCYLIVESAQ